MGESAGLRPRQLFTEVPAAAHGFGKGGSLGTPMPPSFSSGVGPSPFVPAGQPPVSPLLQQLAEQQSQMQAMQNQMQLMMKGASLGKGGAFQAPFMYGGYPPGGFGPPMASSPFQPSPATCGQEAGHGGQTPCQAMPDPMGFREVGPALSESQKQAHLYNLFHPTPTAPAATTTGMSGHGGNPGAAASASAVRVPLVPDQSQGVPQPLSPTSPAMPPLPGDPECELGPTQMWGPPPEQVGPTGTPVAPTQEPAVPASAETPCPTQWQALSP